MQQRIVTLGIVAFTCLALQTGAAEPTQAETTAWIRDQLAQEIEQRSIAYGVSSYRYVSSGEASFDDCTMKFSGVWLSRVWPSADPSKELFLRLLSKTAVPVAKLGPSQITSLGSDTDKPEAWRVEFKTAGLAKVISVRSRADMAPKEEGEWSEANVSSFAVHFPDRELAERFARAIKHLSKLCGKPDEPF